MTIALSSTPLQHLISVPQDAASAEKAAPQAIEQSEVKAAPRSQLQALHQQLQALTEQGKSLHQQLKTLSRDALQGKPLTPRAAQQLEDTKAERQLSLHSLMPNSLPPLAYERVQLALEEFTANAWPGFDDDPSSSWGINDSIGDAIGEINDGYLGVYENAVDAYIAFYAAFSEILAALDTLISGGTDGQTVIVDAQGLKNKLQALIDKFFSKSGVPGENAVLFPPQDGDGAVTGGTEADAKKWAEEMGLDPSCVRKLDDGTYVVTVDLGPIQEMIKNLPNTHVTATDFQIWKAGFDSMDEKMKNTLQTLTQKYSNAQSMTDNLIKVLSATISSLLETDKAFLQI